ncbi:PREDICTED: solute carrier organic anion transporter family member 4C1-like [Branchiostoma belcheri]|uniref:Solute carrier organic anion transporter family member n=1 Tax=Branchiostoma belcheri TaxID=7741 RepID=A0A6P4Z0U5_BRABE|nr:PREDICTED: solute carrier organic anion transporter family member 4C1-like [Branchiostoma belcheri]
MAAFGRKTKNTKALTLDSVAFDRANIPGRYSRQDSALDTPGARSDAPFLQNFIRQDSRAGDFSDEEGDQAETRCGWRRFRPSCLQVFDNPKGFLFFVSFFALVQGTLVNGLINSVISTIEKRFQLPSSKTGIISSGYDIAFGCLSVIITYHGGVRSKPIWLATGAFVLGLGACVFSIPHFVVGPHRLGGAQETTCGAARLNETSDDGVCSGEGGESNWLPNFLYVFILGQLLNGVGGIPLYTFGPQYLEQSVSTKSSGIYLGIFYAVSYLGPAVGFLLGGQLLTLYIDLEKPGVIPPVGGTSDPRWLGAWWLGFLGLGVTAWLLVLPLSGYPKELPGIAKVRREKTSDVHANTESKTLDSNFGKSIRDFPVAVRSLAKNPTFIFITLAGISEGLALNGFATFLPKFVENQFGQTASQAAFLVGCVMVPGAFGGCLIGGAIMRCKKLDVSGSLKLCVILSSIAMLLAPVFLIRCPNSQFAGVTASYTTGATSQASGPGSSLNASCNAACACPAVFDVVCGSDGLEYLSSCHAGCTTRHEGEPKTFSNCACVTTNSSASNTVAAVSPGYTPPDPEVTSGRCGSTCGLLMVFLPLLVVIMVVVSGLTVPAAAVTLRCVPEHQASFAFGLQWMFIRLLGSVPGPILMGAAIDRTCLLWQGDVSSDDTCDVSDRGACWVYENSTMSLYFFIIVLVLKIFSTTCMGLALWLYKPSKKSTQSCAMAYNGEVVTTVSTPESITSEELSHRNGEIFL